LDEQLRIERQRVLPIERHPPDQPRLDHDDLDAELTHLLPQRVSERLDGVPGRRLPAEPG
jgi:hypothetical protein